jgi:hypothetical protein
LGDVTAFDRTETVEVEASNVAEALREACEKSNISFKIREVDDPGRRRSRASSRSHEAEARPPGSDHLTKSVLAGALAGVQRRTSSDA